MTFYLGTHEARWLAHTDVPLCVARQRLLRRPLPRALGPWVLDSGAYTQLSQHGEWRVPARQYAAEVARFAAEVGSMVWAAPQDWMCEPWILAKTGLREIEHQRRSVRSYLELRDLDPALPWIPVLQGWTRDSYVRCADMFTRAGVDLHQVPVVGLGSVCRLQGTAKAGPILAALEPLRLHGFGFKFGGLIKYGAGLASSDSLAWSFNARKNPPLPGHPHRHCNNCRVWAFRWRDRLLAQIGDGWQ